MSVQCSSRSSTPGLSGAEESAAVGATAAEANNGVASVGPTAVTAVVDQAQCFVGFAGLEVGSCRRLNVRDQRIPVQERLDRLDGPGGFVHRRLCSHRFTPCVARETVVINAWCVITIRKRGPARPAGPHMAHSAGACAIETVASVCAVGGRRGGQAMTWLSVVDGEPDEMGEHEGPGGDVA